MKPLLLALCFLTVTAQAQYAVEYVINKDIQIAEELLDDLREEAIDYYVDENGNLHVILLFE